MLNKWLPYHPLSYKLYDSGWSIGRAHRDIMNPVVSQAVRSGKPQRSNLAIGLCTVSSHQQDSHHIEKVIARWKTIVLTKRCSYYMTIENKVLNPNKIGHTKTQGTAQLAGKSSYQRCPRWGAGSSIMVSMSFLLPCQPWEVSHRPPMRPRSLAPTVVTH